MHKKLGINTVVTVADIDFTIKNPETAHLWVNVEDWPDQDLEKHFDKLTNFIEKRLK